MMLKKIFSLLICVIFAVIILAGCGSNENKEIAGEWTLTTVSFNGETVKCDELGIDKDKFGFIFTSSGKCMATIMGITDESDYRFSGTSVDIEINGEKKKLNYSNGTLTLSLNYSGENTLFTFAKVK